MHRARGAPSRRIRSGMVHAFRRSRGNPCRLRGVRCCVAVAHGRAGRGRDLFATCWVGRRRGCGKDRCSSREPITWCPGGGFASSVTRLLGLLGTTGWYRSPEVNSQSRGIGRRRQRPPIQFGPDFVLGLAGRGWGFHVGVAASVPCDRSANELELGGSLDRFGAIDDQSRIDESKPAAMRAGTTSTGGGSMPSRWPAAPRRRTMSRSMSFTNRRDACDICRRRRTDRPRGLRGSRRRCRTARRGVRSSVLDRTTGPSTGTNTYRPGLRVVLICMLRTPPVANADGVEEHRGAYVVRRRACCGDGPGVRVPPDGRRHRGEGSRRRSVDRRASRLTMSSGESVDGREAWASASMWARVTRQ